MGGAIALSFPSSCESFCGGRRGDDHHHRRRERRRREKRVKNYFHPIHLKINGHEFVFDEHFPSGLCFRCRCCRRPKVPSVGGVQSGKLHSRLLCGHCKSSCQSQLVGRRRSTTSSRRSSPPRNTGSSLWIPSSSPLLHVPWTGVGIVVEPIRPSPRDASSSVIHRP